MKVFIALALLIPSVAFACLNVTGTSLDGKATGYEGVSSLDELRTALSHTSKDVSVADKYSRDKWEVSPAEGDAVEKILAGDLEGAIAALTKLEEMKPGNYSTAANLGTAYELKGDNANALKWISTGMARNPESHNHTEWLHALILEAKLEAAKHPDHPLVGHLLEVPERLDPNTQISVDGKNYTAAEVYMALVYQLKERLIFVKPKDPYVADLLVSLAVIQSNLFTVESAQGILQMAREYGFPDEALLTRHEKRFEQALSMRQLKTWGPVALGLILIVLLLYVGYRMKVFFLRSRDYLAHKAAVGAAMEGRE